MKRLLMAVALGCLATSMAFADVYNKKTKVTFSGPFQIPGPNTSTGVITLPPGTYIFRLLDSASNRHIVEVTNMAENKVHSTILAVADYRLNASSKTVMYFSERKSGTPMSLKSWFYPGDNYGHRFVYPKLKAQEIAAATNEPVPSYQPVVIEKTKYVEVPVYIQTPAKQEVAYDAKAFEKTDATDSAGADGEAVKAAPAPAAAPAPLPKTASPLPAIGLLGLLLVAASLLIRRAATVLR